ncbi:MAG: 2,3-bisphosphoglycerate-independent phosphoglycerate mutase [Bacteroidetes bacterium]|nr:2,3-bisphosphoglycerate-independent phosphoglycerate mutase [Bacteroidota bacterium]
MQRKAAIVVLDGWGIGKHDKSDAVWNAETPFTDKLNSSVPYTTLRTDGENVGLPEGQMGNSEVGHMNIGAGRIVWQMLVRINREMEDTYLNQNKIWQQILNQAKGGKKLHLIGLLSDGGVHSHIRHAIQLCKNAAANGVSEIFIHAFLDGRDTDPKGGLQYIQTLEEGIAGTNAKLSSVVGRYFAMDRDKRWERVKKAYDLLTHGTGEISNNIQNTIQKKYEKGITDEFMDPIKIGDSHTGNIEDGDVVLCFNFRTDRGRQITTALSQTNFPEFGMKKLNLHYYTMTEYDEKFHIEGVMFQNQNLNETLGQVISQYGATQLRAAETEKYPHVSFFFSGGREDTFEGESRLLVNSPKVATYDLQPEMSAVELTEKAVEIIQKNTPDFVMLNYANPDMVGHTGVYSAIIKAVETVDACLEKLVTEFQKNNYSVIVIADHGNADFAINDDGTPNTAHTTNPVPCWLIGGPEGVKLHPGILADVAPTILKLMGISQPTEMTGNALF